MWSPRTIVLSWSQVTDVSLVQIFSILVAVSSMKQHLQNILVARVVQLFQDGTSNTCSLFYCVFQHRLKKMEEIMGDRPLHKESWQSRERALTQQQDRYLLLFVKSNRKRLPEPSKMTSSRLHMCVL